MRISVIMVMLSLTVLNAQNLLNTSSWELGSKDAKGFYNIGTTLENSRVMGFNHIGEEAVLWRVKNDGENDADGGWQTDYIQADHNLSYRFSVWVKKVNSHDGQLYFGFSSDNNGVLRGDSSEVEDGEAYFWQGQLPQLNRWYLIVGYICSSDTSDGCFRGGIYDGVTGKKFQSFIGFKFKEKVTNLIHRAYLYYDTNTFDTTYFYEPRIDPINGSEPTIKELLKIKFNASLFITEDQASNQENYSYAYYDDPNTLFGSALKVNTKEDNLLLSEQSNEGVTTAEKIRTNKFNPENNSKKVTEVVNESKKNLISKNRWENIVVFPNPTSEFITFRISSNDLQDISSVGVFSTYGMLLKEVHLLKGTNDYRVNLSNFPTNVYYLKIKLKDNSIVSKKIIKK